MLIQLESHILQLNKFRLNVATPLDYALHFVYLQRDDFKAYDFPMSPEELITLSVPIIHYSMSQYDISRKQYASIALAAILNVLREAHNQAEVEHAHDCLMTGKNVKFETVDRIGNFRESFITNLMNRFPNSFDLAEVLNLVNNLKEQSLKVESRSFNMSSGLLHDAGIHFAPEISKSDQNSSSEES